jgi:hypothetical protein
MNIEKKDVICGSRIYPMGNPNAGAAMAKASQEAEASFPHSRQREVRVNEQKVCAYVLCESVDGKRVIIEQGEVYSLNRSEHGILVLMGSQPQNRQLLELHVAETRWEYSLNLYEVQWAKVVPVESHGDLFLVGCRLVFGASRYWAF